MTNKPQLEEQALSEIIKQGLMSQLNQVKKLFVGVQTNLLKLAQGQIDSLIVRGRGLTRNDLHIEEIEIKTDHISIDPLSILLGKIRLNEPLDADINISLTEQDLNDALNSSYIWEKLPHLHLEVNRKLITVELIPPFKLRLPTDRKIRVSGAAKLHESYRSRTIHFSAVICTRTDDQPLVLETFSCVPGQGLPLPFLISLLQKLNAIVTQPFFRIESSILRIRSLQIHNQTMTLQIEAEAQQIPSL